MSYFVLLGFIGIMGANLQKKSEKSAFFPPFFCTFVAKLTIRVF